MQRLPNSRLSPQLLLAFSIITICLGLGIFEAFLRWVDIGDPPVFVGHPEIGYLLKPSQDASTRGHRFHINQFGLRGADFAMPKPANVYRIVFVGDSVTYGGGAIPDEELFSNRTPAFFKTVSGRPVEGINLSLPGWGIQNMAAYIGTRGCLDADLVVWTVPWADVYRPKTSLEVYAYPVEKPLTRIGYLFTRLYLLSTDLMRRLSSAKEWRLSSDRTRQSAAKILDHNVNSLRTALGSCLAQGAQAIVAVVPSYDEGSADAEGVTEIQRVTNEMSVPFLDLNPVFRHQARESLFLDGAHLSAAGHRVVAEELVRAIKTQSHLEVRT